MADPVLASPAWGVLVLMTLIGYLLGSLSFGILIPKLRSGLDIRQMGSGNAGTTNVLRTQGVKMALWVFLGDLAKGMVAAGIGLVVAGPLGGALASLGSLMGHCYPLYFSFKGGKGIATGVGTVLILLPWAGILALAVFFLVVAKTRYVSLGSIMGAGSLFVTLWFFQPEKTIMIYCLFAAVFTIWKHQSNIQKLKNGTESKLGQSKGGEDDE